MSEKNPNARKGSTLRSLYDALGEADALDKHLLGYVAITSKDGWRQETFAGAPDVTRELPLDAREKLLGVLRVRPELDGTFLLALGEPTPAHRLSPGASSGETFVMLRLDRAGLERVRALVDWALQAVPA